MNYLSMTFIHKVKIFCLYLLHMLSYMCCIVYCVFTRKCGLPAFYILCLQNGSVISSSGCDMLNVHVFYLYVVNSVFSWKCGVLTFYVLCLQKVPQRLREHSDQAALPRPRSFRSCTEMRRWTLEKYSYTEFIHWSKAQR